jgi:hypothetical protein
LLPEVPPAVVTLTFCAPRVALAAIVNVAVMLVALATAVPETVIPPPAGTLMVLPAAKFVPVSVTLTVAVCAPIAGLTAVSVGAGGFTVNATVPVVTPLVVTVTFWLPSVAFAAITKVAVIVVVLVTVTFVVVIPVPLKPIVAGLKKLVPVSVTGTLELSSPLVGVIETSVGGGATVNVWLAVVPPAVVTVTPWPPSGAPAAIWNVAVIVVLFVTVVAVTVIPVPGVTLIVLAPVMKFVPVSVTFTFVPAIPLVGVIAVSVGSGGLTVNITVPVVPPAVVTDTVRAPSVAPAVIVNVAISVSPPAPGVTFVTVTPVPLTATVAPATRFVPVSVTGTTVPCTPLVGLIVVSVGGGGFTVNVWLPEVPPAVVTLTFCPPSVAFAAIVKVAVMLVALATAVAETAIPPPAGTLIALPATKFVPVSVTGTTLPCTPTAGLIAVSVG